MICPRCHCRNADYGYGHVCEIDDHEPCGGCGSTHRVVIVTARDASGSTSECQPCQCGYKGPRMPDVVVAPSVESHRSVAHRPAAATRVKPAKRVTEESPGLFGTGVKR